MPATTARDAVAIDLEIFLFDDIFDGILDNTGLRYFLCGHHVTQISTLGRRE
jgi:hypothetical protein